MARRVFSAEFKAAAVRLVTEQNYGVREAGRSLGVGVNTLRYWIKRHAGGKPGAVGEDQALRKRVRELEAEVQKLKTEREILKKAAAFFAKEHP
jgi:transposase